MDVADTLYRAIWKQKIACKHSKFDEEEPWNMDSDHSVNNQ